MGDGRLIVMDYQPPGFGRSPPWYWHPDRKLPPSEMNVLPKAPIVVGRSETAYGIDGALYFGNEPGGNNVWIALDGKGKVHSLPKHNGLAGLPHALVNGRRVVFTKLGEMPPILPARDGEFIGADRDGRYYLCAHSAGWKGYGRGVTVTAVMPKHEKPGDVLRLEAEKRPLRNIVKDDAGKIYAEPAYGGGLLQLHAGKWIDTPVLPLYHPRWTSRPAPPWHECTWNTARLFRLHGKNGGVFIVRLRDVYQNEEPPDGDRFNPPPLRFRGVHPAPPPPVAKEGERPKYWLEAWLLRDGKWSGPTEVRKLLAEHAATLLSDSPTTGGAMSYFAFAHDGTRLWAAFDGQVLTCDKSGKLTEADWPREKPNRPAPFVILGRLAGGKVLLSGTTGDGHVLSFADGKVKATEFAMLGNHPAANPREQLAYWKLAKDGTLWYWVTDPHGYRAQVWYHRGGKRR
jgi:hypothetical protein